MVPRRPSREGQIGFIYSPPYRVQGISVAGEQTILQVPELDLNFDIGMCPRVALPASYVALSHAHMDHLGGLPYYFSQRFFQKLGKGTCICHPDLVDPIRRMMKSWVDLEAQETPHEIIGLAPGDEFQLRKDVFLRGFEVNHTRSSMGYLVVEKRSKLKEEFRDMPQNRLRELKASGTEITRMIEVPLVACSGDTSPGDFLVSDEFANAKIILCECTFFDSDHRERAKTGHHIHVEDFKKMLLESWKAQDVVITHISRRSDMNRVRQIVAGMSEEYSNGSVHMLMDHRTNRERYESQKEEFLKEQS